MKRDWWGELEAYFGENPRFQTVETAFSPEGAFALLAELRREGMSWEQFSFWADLYLREQRLVPEYMPQHIKHMEALFRPWLG